MDFRSSEFLQKPSLVLDGPAPRWSVRTFLIWLVLACLMPGIIGAAILFCIEYREGRAQQAKDTIQTARALVQTVDSHLLKIQAVAQALSASDSLAKKDLARFYRQAQKVVELAGLGAHVVLRDKAGRQIFNTAVPYGKPLPRYTAQARLQGALASGKPTISDLFICPVVLRPMISVDVPVMVKGEARYFLGIDILPQHFSSIVAAQRLPSDWMVTVFDRGGTIVGRNHAPERFVGHEAPSNLLKRIMEFPEDSMEATTLEGIPVLSFYSRSPITNWTVAIGIPRQALESKLVGTISLMASGMVALFGAGLALAWFMGGRIAGSVRALTTPAIALGNGGSAPVSRVHIREAAEVAVAIGRAADLLKERTEALLAREADLAEAQRLAKLGSWSWDAQTDSYLVSEELLRIFGRKAIPTCAEQVRPLFPSEAWQQLFAATQTAIRSGEGYELTLQALRGDGRAIWIHMRGEAVRDRGGGVAGLWGTVQDVTERKEAEVALERERAFHRQQLEQQVAERTAELVAANRELEAFTFAASHDLKGPLGRINSFSTLLERKYRDHLEGEGLLFLDTIRQNATRLVQLVDDLLSHARIAQQGLELQEVDLNRLVESIIEERAGDIQENGAEVRVSLPPVKVFADVHALTQALSNLLENALKYSVQAQLPVIEVGGERIEDGLRLWVRDNGIGFKMDYHDKIFKMFERLHTYSEYAGSGVGLALVKRAAERMGGRVWAESIPGQGATFYMELQAVGLAEAGIDSIESPARPAGR